MILRVRGSIVDFGLMYTVGMISRDNIKTSAFNTYEAAIKDIKVWKQVILNNHIVEKRITTINRNSNNVVTTIREEFYTADYGKIIVFLSENN